MTRYFAGNTLASFFRTSNSVAEITTSGRFDSAFVPNAIFLPVGVAYAETYAFSATGTVWTHFDYFTTGVNGGQGIATWVNGTTNVFRLYATGVYSFWQELRPQYWNGSAWTNAGATFFAEDNTLLRFDVKIVLGTSYEVYLAGTRMSSGSTGGGSTVTNVRFQSPDFISASGAVSQVLVSDFDTRDSRYMQAVMDGNSVANTGGTGTYTDVSETVLDESTAEYVSVSGNKMGQTWANITVPTGYIIGAVSMGARGRVEGAITDGKLGLRSGGTNYSGSAKTYNSGYEPRGRIDEVDPNTSGDWSESLFNSVETFIEAV